jgi:hypothetical protein
MGVSYCVAMLPRRRGRGMESRLNEDLDKIRRAGWSGKGGVSDRKARRRFIANRIRSATINIVVDISKAVTSCRRRVDGMNGRDGKTYRADKQNARWCNQNPMLSHRTHHNTARTRIPTITSARPLI